MTAAIIRPTALQFIPVMSSEVETSVNLSECRRDQKYLVDSSTPLGMTKSGWKTQFSFDGMLPAELVMGAS